MARKKQLISDINNVAFYIVPYNSINVLCKRPLGLSVVKKIHLFGKKAKGYIYRYLKTMEENINPVFHAWVIIEHVAVKIVEFKNISF